MKLYFILLIGVFLIGSTGCVRIAYSKDNLKKYFQNIPLKTNVKVVENKLGLKEPIETRAPAYGENAWTFRYELKDKNELYYIFFDADYIGKNNNIDNMRDSSCYIYLGNYKIYTWDEWVKHLKKLGVIKTCHPPPQENDSEKR